MTRIWAHRGASADAPENTLEAFDLARTLGAHGVELDVQLSQDGQPVVIHDETLERTAGVSGRVAERSLRELRMLDVSCGMSGYAGARIPTLRDAFELLLPAGMTINVELKTTPAAPRGLERAVVSLVRELDAYEQVICSSFNHVSLRAFRDSGVRRGLLFDAILIDPWFYASALGMNAIHPSMVNLEVPGLVEECHRRNLAVNPWTLDDPEDIETALSLGVDALITNHPALALRLRERAPKPAA